jgi:methionyl-tRNA formyltransferase
MSELKIVVAGTHFGVNQLLKWTPPRYVSAILVPYNRPESINFLKFVSFVKKIPLLVHNKFGTVEQSESLKKIENLKCNCLISNSYPLIFKSDILNYFGENIFNFHAALLPKNRGCDPVNWSIMNGDKFTGLTFHQINEGTDTGKIMHQSKIEIDFEDTWISVLEKIQIIKKDIFEKSFTDILSGKYQLLPQNEAEATFNKKITEKDLKIDFDSMSDLQIYNLIRANISPSKPAFYIKNNKKIELKKFVPFSKISSLRFSDTF